MKLYELEKQFGTEQQCREYIAALRWQNGYRCPRCQSNKAWKTRELKYKCQNCGYKTSVTSGTIFQDSHVPLPIWFKAIWLMSSDPVSVTGKKLQETLNLGSNRTALSLYRNLKRMMVHPQLDKLQGTVEFCVTNIFINNKTIRIMAAVEKNENRIGRIRIQPCKSTEDIVEFIWDCIEMGSTIIHREYRLNSFELCEAYIEKHKNERYKFLCINKVLDKLAGWTSTKESANEETLFDEFCMRFNSLKNKNTFSNAY